MQDELSADGLLLGVARAEPYAETERLIAERRARGLFGDLRFTLTNTPRSCHPERLVRGARSVIAAALPLWRPAAPPPDGAGRPHAALRLERPLRAAARAPGGAGRAPAGARCALRGLRRLQPPRRSRRRRARRARVLGAQHDGDRAGPGLVRRPRGDRHRRRAGAGRRARAARLRLVHALPRRLPDGRPDRARACSTRPAASPRRRRRAGRCPRHTLRRSRIACTAATSARTCAPGTPARRAALPICPRIRAPGCRWPSGSSCRARSCWRGTHTSTCPSATRVTCAATP